MSINPTWSNPLLKNVEKAVSEWEVGYDLSHIDDEKVIEKFCNYAEILLNNQSHKYNSAIISQLIKKDVLFLKDQMLSIGGQIYRIGGVKDKMILDEIKINRNVSLIFEKNTKNDLVYFLKSMTLEEYERELIFIITNKFDELVYKNKMEKAVDMEFVNQIYATMNDPFDLVKFVFFTMAQHEVFKKEPLFKTLYGYVSFQNLDEIYLFLRKN